MTKSQEPVVTVLDTAAPSASPSDTGLTQAMDFNYLKLDYPARFYISLGSGDTVVIEGKASSADSFVIQHTWTGGDETPADVYLSRIWRVRRTVDGVVGESVVKMENRHTQILQEDD